MFSAFSNPLFASINWHIDLDIISGDPCSGDYHLQAVSLYGPQEGSVTITLQEKVGGVWYNVDRQTHSYLEGEYDFFLTKHIQSPKPSIQEYRAYFEFDVSATDPMGHWNGNYYDGYTDEANNYEISIYNMNGQIVAQRKFSDSKITIPGKFPAGIYLVIVQDAHGNLVWKDKFVQ